MERWEGRKYRRRLAFAFFQLYDALGDESKRDSWAGRLAVAIPEEESAEKLRAALKGNDHEEAAHIVATALDSTVIYPAERHPVSKVVEPLASEVTPGENEKEDDAIAGMLESVIRFLSGTPRPSLERLVRCCERLEAMRAEWCDAEEFAAVHRDMVESLTVAPGPNHPLTRRARWKLAEALLGAGRPEVALARLEEEAVAVPRSAITRRPPGISRRRTGRGLRGNRGRRKSARCRPGSGSCRRWAPRRRSSGSG